MFKHQSTLNSAIKRRSRMARGAIITLIAVSINSPLAEAADIVLRCETPYGKYVHYGTVLDVEGRKISSVDDGIRWDEGSYPKDMRPVFIWREDVPDKLQVISGTWPADEATVTYRDKNQIQALVRRCGAESCTTAIYTLFPRLGFATEAEMGHWSDVKSEGEGTARMWATTCKD